MKKIDELGISPWPWKADEEGWVDDVNGVQVITNAGALVSLRDIKKNPDARLISAAPELYEALRELYEWCFLPFTTQYNTFEIMRSKAELALVKASGEDVS